MMNVERARPPGRMGLRRRRAAARRRLADEASSTGAAFSRGWEFAEQGGADLFDHVCAACHQPDARGAAGAAAYPPLAGDKKLVSADFMLDRASSAG